MYIYDYIIDYTNEQLAAASEDKRKEMMKIKTEIKLKGIPAKYREKKLV